MLEQLVNIHEMNRFDQIIALSENIVKESISSGVPSNNALAAISTYRLEKVIKELELGYDRRGISRVLKKKLNINIYGGNIEELRQIVAKHIFPNESFISYNQRDLITGFKHPGKISFPIAYLLGIYRTDLNYVEKSLTNHRVRISGKGEDEPFYREILAPLIKKVFSIDVKVESDPRKKNGYEWNDVHIEFSSKEHTNYLQSVGFIDDYRNFREMHFESVKGIDIARIDEYKEAYLMGMIAGSGHIADRKMKSKAKSIETPRCIRTDTQLHFKNKKMDYLPELKRMIEELGIESKYTNPPKKLHFLYFIESEFARLRNHQPKLKLFSDQVGYFTHPKHTDLVIYL